MPTPPELHLPFSPIHPLPSSLPPSSWKARDARAATPEQALRYYRPELDVLRCLAFFLVFNHHVLPISFTQTRFRLGNALQESGAAGVCLFFMLSAFLITELLLREKEATGTIHIRAFYMRRILRIWPLYLLTMALAVALPHMVHGYHFEYVGRFVMPYLLLCGNWVFVLHHSWPHNPLLNPLWSISVEEQFYLVWPTLILLGGARGIACTAMFIVPLAWAIDFVLPTLGMSKDPQLWCNSFNQFQFFALGGVLALVIHRRSLAFHPSLFLRLVCFTAAFTLLLLSAYPFHYLNPVLPLIPGQTLAGYLCIDAACLLLICAFLNAKLPLFSRPLIYLGRISYGMYVFHYAIRLIVGTAVVKTLHVTAPFQLVSTYAVTGLLTILLASLSYRYFEKPFLRFKDRFTFVPSRAA